MGNDLIEGADAQTTFLHNFKVCKIFKFFFFLNLQEVPGTNPLKTAWWVTKKCKGNVFSGRRRQSELYYIIREVDKIVYCTYFS